MSSKFERTWDHWPNAGEMVTALANVPHHATYHMCQYPDPEYTVMDEDTEIMVVFRACWE